MEDTFGKVIVEAMACGTPAIVYGITGCAEIVSKNSGYVVKVGNIESIINKIQLIKTNNKKYYTKSCIENVKSRFSYDRNAIQLIELYKEVKRQYEYEQI